MMLRNKYGALPRQEIITAIEKGEVKHAQLEHVSPASLDLTLSDEWYEIDAAILPQPGETVKSLLPKMNAKAISGCPVFSPNKVYLIRLWQQLALPRALYGYCNPKSSTGRLDVHVRVLVDGVCQYDTIPRGYNGDVYLVITPRSFSVQLHAGVSLVQLRLFTGDARFTELDLEREIHDGLVWHPSENRMMKYGEITASHQDGSLVLTALVVDGYKCTADPDQVVDVLNIGGYNGSDFFKPINVRNDIITLRRGHFYILSGAERIKLPPTVASEMVPIDDRLGEFRSHYAGFLDPGWGYGPEGDGTGRPFTLEVRPYEDVLIRPGQPIARIKFERMLSEPDVHYDAKAKISHYRKQTGPTLGKQFK
jgi:dCTP deaminase